MDEKICERFDRQSMGNDSAIVYASRKKSKWEKRELVDAVLYLWIMGVN